MPPRRSARVAPVAERATTALSPLPLSVVLHIFSLLPVDCRLRCAEVCRGWRAVLLERSLWTRLDVTHTSGVQVPDLYGRRSLDALLRCAAARAGGGLHSLQANKHLVTHAALLDVLTANAGALREVHAHTRNNHPLGYTPAQVEALLGAAPQLRTFAAELYCEATEVQATRRALRNEAPFDPMRVRHLFANLGNEDEAGVMAFTADVATHASLKRLKLFYAPLETAAALDAVVDAALARRMQRIELLNCSLSPASAPALARLLGSDALTALKCAHMHRLLDAPAARVLAAALRANSTLTSLTLAGVGVFDDAAATAELLDALTGHASLRLLSLHGNRVQAAHQAAAGAALGAFVAANVPALTELDILRCALGDDGLRALFQALPHNTCMRTLDCRGNTMSEAFARDVLLPAVRGNASLQSMVTDGNFDGEREAMQLVRDRQ
jgi:hypothetical protein